MAMMRPLSRVIREGRKVAHYDGLAKNDPQEIEQHSAHFL
jgi:hypothetical protein